MLCASCRTALRKTRAFIHRTESAARPIFKSSGETDWEIGMSHSCGTCDKIVSSTDGEPLHTLPCWLSSSLDADPRFCTSNTQHLVDRLVSRLLVEAMLTHASADWMSRTLHNARSDLHLCKEAAHCSGNVEGQVFAPFPKLKQWRGKHPPSGAQLRDLVDKTASLPLTLSGVGDKERHTREIQSVGACPRPSTTHSTQRRTSTVAMRMPPLLSMQMVPKLLQRFQQRPQKWKKLPMRLSK